MFPGHYPSSGTLFYRQRGKGRSRLGAPDTVYQTKSNIIHKKGIWKSILHY